MNTHKNSRQDYYESSNDVTIVKCKNVYNLLKIRNKNDTNATPCKAAFTRLNISVKEKKSNTPRGGSKTCKIQNYGGSKSKHNVTNKSKRCKFIEFYNRTVYS